ERQRDEAVQAYYEGLVHDYDTPDGPCVARLRADAVLSLQTVPAGAEVVAYRYVERDRVMSAEGPVSLGRTPISDERLAPGSYLLALRREGYRDVRYPVMA